MKRCIHFKPFLLAVAFLTGVISLAGTKARCADSPSIEYQVKAACLYNFAKFVDWPPQAFADPKSPIMFGILGADPLGNSLERIIKDKTINGRPLMIKRSQRVEDLKDCHVLFIGRSEQNRLAQILKSLEGLSILTVGDSPEFLEQGGIINFKMLNDKVRFDVNVTAAGKASLKISSELLDLATIVRSGLREKED